jgi:hypothetical protein
MNLLEAIEAIETNPELKNKFVNKCIEVFGVSIETTKRKVWKHEFLLEDNDWEIMTVEPSRDVEDIHDEIIRSMQLKEYNDIRIAKDIINEKAFEKIAVDHNTSLKHIRTIKKKIYEAIKTRQD